MQSVLKGEEGGGTEASTRESAEMVRFANAPYELTGATGGFRPSGKAFRHSQVPVLVGSLGQKP